LCQRVSSLLQVFMGGTGVSNFENIHAVVKRYGSIDDWRDRLKASLVPFSGIDLRLVIVPMITANLVQDCT